MKDAEIFDGEDGFYVALYIDGNLFGTIDMSEHSIHYAEDAVFNWQAGILTEENPHIEKCHV